MGKGKKQPSILRDLVDDGLALKKRMDSDKKKLETINKNILNIKLQSNESDRDALGSVGKATVCSKTTLTFFEDKLREKLPKELHAEMVDKSYKLSEPEKFIKELKRLGVPLELVKKHISSELRVNEKRINKLFEDGIVQLEDLEHCYDSKTSFYLRYTESKEKK